MPMKNAPSGLSWMGTDGWPTLLQQAGDDQRNGLRAQIGQPRQVGFRHAAVQAYRLQHDALVELAHADLVGAARAQPRLAGFVGAHAAALPLLRPIFMTASVLRGRR